MKWKEWHEHAKNEALWRGHEEKGLLKAEYVRDFVLRLWFEDDLDVSIYELDFYPLIMEDDPGEVFLPLRDRERFRLASRRLCFDMAQSRDRSLRREGN
ncbi:MAG TPA: hypothetical protein VGD14_16135 [bacterium]